MMCRLWACPFYGTIEHARCSSCRLGLDGPMVVGEMEALVAMNISESEIIPDAEVEERVLWIQKSKRQALFVTNDSIKGASNVLHLGSRRLRVAAAEKLMTAIKSKNIDSNCAPGCHRHCHKLPMATEEGVVQGWIVLPWPIWGRSL